MCLFRCSKLSRLARLGDFRAHSSLCGGSGGNHRNPDRRRMLGIVEDRVGGRDKLAARRLIRAGVQVAIKPWKIAAGNLKAKDVPFLKSLLVAHRSTVTL